MRSALQAAGCLLGILAGVCALVAQSAHAQAAQTLTTLNCVSIPPGYRQWQLIAPAQEAPPPNERRAVLGNAKAVAAYAP